MTDLNKIIDDCGGIHPPHIAFYMESIRFNCEAALESAQVVSDFIEKTNGEYEMNEGLQTHLLDNIQNMLTHAAALSRYFWPTKSGLYKVHKKRAKKLREIFGLDSSSPIKSRNLRNQLEHFDENLDNYLWEKPLAGRVIPSFVGGTPMNDGVPTHFFRAFYIDSGTFETLGNKYQVQPISDELIRIWKIVDSQINR
jgi:hypothetical protein